MSEFVTRLEYEQIIRRRLHAVDRGLSAMLVILQDELAADDPAGLENLRAHFAELRNEFLRRYPFAADVIGPPVSSAPRGTTS